MTESEPRIRSRRDRVIDAAIAAAVTGFVLTGTLLGVNFEVVPGDPSAGDVLMICVICGSLYFRRRYPILVAVFTLVGTGLYYMLTSVDGPIVLSFVVALYTVAAERHLTMAVVLAAAALLAVAFGEAQGSGRHLDNVAMFMLVGWLVAVIAMGAVAFNRRAYLQEAERAKEETAVQRATQERLRIARELHDVLGHNLSLINVQASAAVHRKDPAQAHEALVAIKDSSKDALRELRATLGVLRQVDEAAPTAPAAGLSRLGELIDRAGATGLDVRAEVSGQQRPVPAEIDLAAYRIVQEALTNVTRHAQASSALVRISYTDDDVSVQVDDDGVGSSENGGDMSGNGIVGMGERARALGGSLTAGARPEGGFRVLARLPLGEQS